MTRVPYVTGRRKALARGMALEWCKREGVDWSRLSPAERRRRIREINDVIGRLVDTEVLVEFVHEWRG